MKVKKISVANVQVSALPELLDAERIGFRPVDIVDRPETNPCKSKVEFRMAHTGEVLLLHYRVREVCECAAYDENNASVWMDAVGFFSTFADDGVYYNVACNCIGTILVGAGDGVSNSEYASAAVMNKVERWSSLVREPMSKRMEQTSWDVALIIPCVAFFKHSILSLDGTTMRAHFYRSGNELHPPHLLSSQTTTLEKPDSFCPDFFGTLEFD